MKMKMIAAAVVAGLAAPAAFAAPTLYGAIHLSVDNLDNGASASNKLMTLSSNSSFIGIKGDEDLGDGLKAVYGAEWQMAFDAAAASNTSTTAASNFLANRNVFAGLSGGFGTLKAGQIDDIVKTVGRAVDLFWNEQLGESRSLTRGFQDDERLANSLNYESPKLGGAFTITVNYGMENTSADDSATVTGKGNAVAIGGVYSAGPLYVGLAHKATKIQGALKAAGDSTSVDRLAAQYTMGNIKISAFYQKDKDMGGLSGADRTTMGLGAAFTMGKGVLKAQYYAAGEVGGVSNTKGTLTAVGYDYNLSANTAVYAAYASVSNDSLAAYSVIGAGHANPNDATTGMPSAAYAASSGTLTLTNPGNDPSGISVGIKVKF